MVPLFVPAPSVYPCLEIPEVASFLWRVKPYKSGSQHRWEISKLRNFIKPQIESEGAG